MAIVIDANMKLFAERMQITSSRMIREYGLSTVDEIIEKDFAQKSAKDVYYLAQTPEDAINYLKNYVPNYKEKTFDDIYVSAK